MDKRWNSSNRPIGAMGEHRQLGFVTLNSNLVVSGWVGLAYDGKLHDKKSRKDIIS